MAADIEDLQLQIKHLMGLIEKLTRVFRAIKAELEESRVEFDSIRKCYGGSEHVCIQIPLDYHAACT